MLFNAKLFYNRCMKTNNIDIVIYVRKSKNSEVIVLVKKIVQNGTTKYKRISTGEVATNKNLEHYKYNALKEWEKLTETSSYVAVAVEEFWEECKRHILQDCGTRTTVDIEQKMRDYILPVFGKVDIKTIEPLDIEEWQLNLKDWKKADMTRRCKHILSRVFDRAVVSKLILYNPAMPTQKIRRPKKEKKVIEIYSKKEIGLMLSSDAPFWLKVFMMCMVYLGMRPNEVIALVWDDIWWESEKIHIARAINMGVEHEPKTGERVVDIHQKLLVALKQLYAESEHECVFPTMYGTQYKDSSSVNRRWFMPLLERLHIRYRTMYSLKHSYISHSLGGGQSILYPSKQVGHSSIDSTYRFYAKLVDDEKAKLLSDDILDF